LSKLDKKELIGLITELYKKDKSAKEYLDFYIATDEDALFEKYHHKVIDAFYKKNADYDLKAARQAISDFKKLGASTELQCALMLLYVQSGVDFTSQYGDISESFYSSLEGMYFKALTLMKEEGHLPKFVDAAFKVVNETDGIGWGFHDALSDNYFTFFGDYID
jgi:hypothetical protein